VIAGAEQAFATGIPEITHGHTIGDALVTLPTAANRIALDNYESPTSLGASPIAQGVHHVLAIGGERGWSPHEREMLRVNRFTFVHLGARVLRTETATVAALSILRAKLGLM
jgi:RsmE family RNA methyltransferase